MIESYFRAHPIELIVFLYAAVGAIAAIPRDDEKMDWGIYVRHVLRSYANMVPARYQPKPQQLDEVLVLSPKGQAQEATK